MTSQLERLLQRLQQTDGNLTRKDFESFSDLNRAELTCFVNLWSDVPTRVRAGLIAALAQLAEESLEYNFERIFREVLNDPDPEVRLGAVRGLWECEDQSLAGAFLHMLQNDSDEKVRAAVATGLGRFVYLAEMDEVDPPLATAIETALFTAIRNPEEPLEVRRRSVEAVGFSCHSEVPDIIKEAYEHEHQLMRVSALFAMGRSADRRWRKIILEEIENDDNEIRFEAIRAAGELAISEAVDPLAYVLDHESDVSIRQAAVWSLGQIGGKTSRHVLELVIASEDDELYEVAQDALEELSFKAEFPEILEFLQSDEDEDLEQEFAKLEDEWETWGGDELDPFVDDQLDDDDYPPL